MPFLYQILSLIVYLVKPGTLTPFLDYLNLNTCYISAICDPPQTFWYDFHIFSCIDHYLSVGVGDYGLTLLTHFCSKLIWVKRDVVRAKRVFCQLAVKEIGYSGAEVARFPGITTSAVNGSANSEEIPEVNRDLWVASDVPYNSRTQI